MPLPTTAVYDLARAALDAIASRWPDDAEPLPERQFVSNGLVVWDCEEVAVAVERTFGAAEGDVSAEAYSPSTLDLVGIRGASLAIWILRCVPDMTTSDDGTVTLPSPESLEASAQILLGDSVALLNVLVAAQRAGELATCNGIAFESWGIEGPQGGIGGGVFRARLLLL